MTLLFWQLARPPRYEYLDEDSPDSEESNPPDRGLCLSGSPPATLTSPPAAAPCFFASTRKAYSVRLGHEPNDVVGRRIRAAISDCTIRYSHANRGFAHSMRTCWRREQTLWAEEGGDRNYCICCRRLRNTDDPNSIIALFDFSSNI
jgi:hypothetical protein